ncbi:MAG: tetratricopeptide repeat protein [Bacteroidota bacterium]
MLKTRIILLASCAVIVALLFLLPKSVVENEGGLAPEGTAMTTGDGHQAMDPATQVTINQLKAAVDNGRQDRNNAIFADSLASLYAAAGRYDSAAIYKERSATFFDTPEAWTSAGEAWYQAFTFSLNEADRSALAGKAQEIFRKILDKDPNNAGVKVKLAMTYIGTSTPMQGITLLREVIAADPKNEEALLKMGTLSIQSGQFGKAIDWLKKLEAVNPENIEGQLLLGAAYAGAGEKDNARAQYERTRKLTNDPAVQQQLDQYLKDLE